MVQLTDAEQRRNETLWDTGREIVRTTTTTKKMEMDKWPHDTHLDYTANANWVYHLSALAPFIKQLLQIRKAAFS